MTLEMEGDVTPVVTSEKSVVPTPVTLSLKVTVKLTLVALVGLAPAKLIEDTVGATVSLVKVLPVPGACTLPTLSVARERTV